MVIGIFPIFDQLDISLHLVYRVNIVAGKIISDAYDAWNGPVDLISDIFPQLFNDEEFEVGFIVG